MSDRAMSARSKASGDVGGGVLGGPVATVTRTIQVAAGVFAPGHLGELTRHVPFELVDSILEESRATERRLRVLPSRVGMYFVLALCLFPQVGYGKVWAKLVAGLGELATVWPSAKALRDLRRRVGVAAVKALFEVLAGPIAQPHTRGVRYGSYRTVAFDGCVSFKVADSEANRSWLSKLNARHGQTGYPVVELMALVETGTRALLGAVFGPPKIGETNYARRLLGLLGAGMLVLADRGFDSGKFLEELAGTGAKFLIRARNNRRLPVLARLDDGSYLSRVGELTVRVITADITVTCADGTTYAARYRLVTTLLDPRRHPARRLIGLYHERWEHEIAYLALHHTLADGRVLRSSDPAGLEQQMWAMLTVYQALRHAMVAAVESIPGLDPDRASFTTALETTKELLINAQGVISHQVDLVGDIGRAVLADLLEPRRPRTSVRKVKSPLSKYNKKDPYRPEPSTKITKLVITIHDPGSKSATTHDHQCLTTDPDP